MMISSSILARFFRRMVLSRRDGRYFLIWIIVFLLVPFQSSCAYQIIQSGKINADRLAQIKMQTSMARGLSFLKDVQSEVLDEKQTDAVLRDMVRRDFPEAEWKAWQKIFYRLDAVPKDFNLYDEMLKLYLDQACGFYDPPSKKLYISTKPIPAGAMVPLMQFFLQRDLLREFVLTHEMTHALQDQHFDLTKILLSKKDNFDEVLAIHALLEGDALFSGMMALLGDSKQVLAQENFGKAIRQEATHSTEALKETPPLIREYLIFPYYGGMDFVQAFVKKNSWGKINALYEKLPASTEQILHPEKYAAGEMPVPVDLVKSRQMLQDDWNILHEDTLGEAMIRTLLGLPAAAGWGGDRFFVAEGKKNSDQEIFVWETVWDSEADAERFEKAMVQWQKKRGAQDVEVYSGGAIVRVRGEWEILGRDGTSVRYVQAPLVGLAREVFDKR